MSNQKERLPAFLFYPRQFSGDELVQAMDLDAVGAHITLISAAAASPERYRIYADEHAIRNRLRNPSEQDWQRIKKQLLAGAWKISADGQWWEQHGLRRTFEKQKGFSQQQSDRAKKGWSKRHAETMPDGCRNGAEQDAGSMLSVSVSNSREKLQVGESGQNVAHLIAREHGITDRHTVLAITDQISIEIQTTGRDELAVADEVRAAMDAYKTSDEFQSQYRKSWKTFFGDRDTWRKFVTKTAGPRKVITPSQAQAMALARCE